MTYFLNAPLMSLLHRNIMNCLVLLLSMISVAMASGTVDNFAKLKEELEWSVGDCILAQMTLDMTVYLNVTEVKTNTTIPDQDVLHITLPRDAKVDADETRCGNDSQTLHLTWQDAPVNASSYPDSPPYLNRTLILVFGHDNHTYGISRVYGEFDAAHFKSQDPKTNETVDIKSKVTLDTGSVPVTRLMFRVPLNYSYMCADLGNISIPASLHFSFPDAPQAGTKLDNATVHAVQVQMDAFRSKYAPEELFQTPQDCDMMPHDVVPLVVGVILTLLVLSVLAAYFYGRRRANMAATYQSV